MNQLYLVIKHAYLEQILSGTKTNEIREVTPATQNRYFKFDDNGEFDSVKEYTSLKLAAGYEKARPVIEVEVSGITVEFLQDEDGNDLTYMHKGEEYDAMNVIYSLGNILSRTNC